MTIPSEIQDGIEQFLKREYFENSLERWSIALAVLVVGTLVLGIVKRVTVHRLGKIAEHTDTRLDDLVVDLVRRTARFFLLTIAFYFAAQLIHWPEVVKNGETISPIHDFIAKAIKLAFWLQVGLWGRGLVTFGIQHMVRGKGADDPGRTMGAGVLGFIGQTVLWSLVLMLCLDGLGFEIKTLIASLGVGGIAVALALQNVLGDLFASITILLDKPFMIGDAITLGDFNGTVEHIGIKTTRLRSVSGEQIIIGNQDLVSSRVRNFKRLNERRNVFTVGVSYQTPYEQVAAIPDMLKKIVESVPDARFDRAHMKSFGDSALVYEVVYFVKRPEYNTFMDVQQAINLAIHRRFEEEGIDFAFPTQTVHLMRAPNKPESKAPAGQDAATIDAVALSAKKELSRG